MAKTLLILAANRSACETILCVETMHVCTCMRAYLCTQTCHTELYPLCAVCRQVKLYFSVVEDSHRPTSYHDNNGGPCCAIHPHPHPHTAGMTPSASAVAAVTDMLTRVDARDAAGSDNDADLSDTDDDPDEWNDTDMQTSYV